MRRISILVLISIFLFSTGFGQSNREIISGQIVWHDSIELGISDFLSEIPSEKKIQTTYNINCRAISSCNIRIILEEDENIDFTVYPIFEKRKSWIDTSGLSQNQTMELLDHEMGHFNLNEYAARLIRKMVDSLDESGCSDVQKYWSVIQDAYTELDRLNEQYDEESLHGMILFKQEEWDEIIGQKLASLDDYSTINYLLAE